MLPPNKRRRVSTLYNLLVVCTILPELRVITVNGDGVRYIEGIFKDKLHVFSRAQAGIKQVLGSDGLAQHVGDSFHLTLLLTGFEVMTFSVQLPVLLGPVLTPSTMAKMKGIQM